MRHLTKEWYMTMQRSHLCTLFKADERAAQRDEALFEEAFEESGQEIKEWIEDFCSMSETSEDLDGWANHLYHLHEITGDEKHKSTSAAYEYYHRHPEVFREVMLLRLRDTMEYNRKFYPPEILSMVADERVFACEVATAEVIEYMRRAEKENERRVYEALDRVNELRAALKGKVSDDILKYFDFHDVKVNVLRREENDLIIETDAYCNDYQITEIRLHDCRIESMDDDIEGAYWIYEELDMTSDGRIRAGILLYKNSENPYDNNTADVRLREINLTARNITFTRKEGVQEREDREQRIVEEIELEYGSADDMSYEQWCAIGCAIDEACRGSEM